MKTIVGIATPVGFGGIGIVRLSGPQAFPIIQKMFNRPLKPRHATLGELKTAHFTDTAIVIYFPAPHSFTGEDVVEIQAHGGWHLVNRIMQHTITLGATPAEPGEFTRTAVLNHKMTLTQAESSIELINAESDAELANASRLLAGDLQTMLTGLEDNLVAARAQIDAYLDYPEDLDSPTVPMTQINQAKATIDRLIGSATNGRLIKNGINVCLIGCPNAGKSSLFNALIHANRSIVTNIAGTTTDAITETITHHGIKINFIDTAGIREGDNIPLIEQQGIARAKEMAKAADILLIVVDAATRQMVDFPRDKQHLIIYNKSDLCPDVPADGIPVSAKTGHNLDLVLDRIVAMTAQTPAANAVLNLTNERQVNELQQAATALNQIQPNEPLDKIAANITLALSHIGKITGSDVDAKTLDEIFSKFCLGK